MKAISICVGIGAIAAGAGMCMAGPDLPVTKPPVVGPFTGPPIDPPAVQGQWFKGAGAAGFETVRPWEFHDNIPGFGGGVATFRAIEGNFAGYRFDPTGAFATGYSIQATIRNDTGTEEGPWSPGQNTHTETRTTTQKWVGPLFDTKLTVHWADDGIQGNFLPGGPNIPSTNPWAPGVGESNTYAMSYDELGWYSYAGQGAYQVPTWDFGTIPVGGSVTRLLNFGFYTPIPLAALPVPPSPSADLFINRTNDLKIGQYFQDDPILNGIVDTGAPYPFGGINNEYGNVSVFNTIIPSPGATALLALGLVGIARRRRA